MYTISILKFQKSTQSKSYITIILLRKSYNMKIKYSSHIIKLTNKDFEFILILPNKYKNINNIEIINQTI